MPKRLFAILPGIFFSLLLGGCISAPVIKPADLPEQLKETGMVMLQVAPTQTWGKAEVSILGGGKREAHHGFYLQELKPGRYIVDSVKLTSGYSSSYNTRTTHFKRLDLGFEFQIYAGKVTDLGLVYLRPDQAGKKYNILRFQNGDTPRRYLKQFHPALAGNLRTDQIVQDDGQYDNHRIEQVRSVLVEDMKTKPNRKIGDGPDLTTIFPAIFQQDNYLLGDLGTLVDKTYQRGNKVQFIETGTLEHLTALFFTGKREWFLSERGLLLTRDGQRLARVNSPEGFYPIRGALLTGQGIVLADRYFNLAISMDNGLNWQVHRQEPDDGVELQGGTFNHSQNGIYAIAWQYAWLGGVSRVVAIDAQTGHINKISIPEEVGNDIRAISDTDLGVFLQRVDLGDPDTLYFKAKGSSAWQKNEILNYVDCRLSFPAGTGEKVIAKCGRPRGSETFVSRDQGASWKPL